jgi:hypothetical protein
MQSDAHVWQEIGNVTATGYNGDSPPHINRN